MSGDTYLRSILRKYDIDVDGAKAAGNTIYPVIQNWGRSYLVKAEFSGSLAKGTGVNLGTDADIFISVSSTTPGTLADLYETLFNAVTQSGYTARRQNVSIGTAVNGYKIDLVPGKRQSQHGNSHSLYKSRSNSWTLTNINTHINHVKGSNRADEIRMAKIWRQLHNLDFPSFYLEMAVIDSLRYATVGNLSANFHKVLQFFRDNLPSTRYVDPANSNNIISDDLNATQKAAVSNQAKSSLNQQTWGGVVW